MAVDREKGQLVERFRAIREDTGLTQLQFLARLNAAAESAGLRPYAQSALSRLENGLQAATLDDVAVFAAVDARRRGKLWLAWGEARDATLAPIKQPPEALRREQAPSSRTATKKGRTA